MTDLIKCPNCAKPYRFDKLRECPSCGNPTPKKYDPADSISLVVSGGDGDLDPVGKLKNYPSLSRLRKASGKDKSTFQSARQEFESHSSELVMAQNRTTNAVRALAKFFIYNFIWSAISGLIFAIAFALPRDQNCGYYSCSAANLNGFAIFLLVIGCIVALAGACVTVAVSLDELNKS